MAVFLRYPDLHAKFIERYSSLTYTRSGMAAAALSGGALGLFLDSYFNWRDNPIGSYAWILAGILLLRQQAITRTSFLDRIAAAIPLLQASKLALLFQYGSNMSTARLNGSDRLAGDAKRICIAKTSGKFDFGFTVWSESNGCAAADIVSNPGGEHIYGVVYQVPEYLLSRETATVYDRRSMDAIEGESKNYIRKTLEVSTLDGDMLSVLTYVVRDPKPNLKTNAEYVTHILSGLEEHKIPIEYRDYVKGQIKKNNPEIDLNAI